MNLVVDASVLVGEVLRARGLALLAHPELTLFQPTHMANETAHELRRRGTLMVRSGRAGEQQVATLLENATAFLSARIIHVAEAEYALYETVARRRVPRDPNDWMLVALALHLGGVPLLTLDGDFFGCGLPTWTPETLRDHLGL